MSVRVRFHRGAWWLFIHHRGRRKSKRIGDRVAALSVARQVRQRLARTDLDLEPSAQEQTFRAYADQWLATARRNLKASTTGFYEDNLERYICPILGPRPVTTLRRSDCRELVTAAGHVVSSGLLCEASRGPSAAC
jgi:integrase